MHDSNEHQQGKAWNHCIDDGFYAWQRWASTGQSMKPLYWWRFLCMTAISINRAKHETIVVIMYAWQRWASTGQGIKPLIITTQLCCGWLLHDVTRLFIHFLYEVYSPQRRSQHQSGLITSPPGNSHCNRHLEAKGEQGKVLTCMLTSGAVLHTHTHTHTHKHTHTHTHTHMNTHTHEYAHTHEYTHTLRPAAR